ncbi:MAG: ATP-dependent sacrificial sulfur transferase LarE, partial [Planctomycetota bacterium]
MPTRDGPTREVTVENCRRIVAMLGALDRCVVAFSGGVDSAVVAKAAQLALGRNAVAATGTSSSLAEGELDAARRAAEQIGIRHEVLQTEEIADPQYRANAPDRCFHCKDELYVRLNALAERLGGATLVNGANADDLGDFRPGMKAARQHGVRSPLAECGVDKAATRQMALHWGLDVWDKPATPCLSSRVVYGLEVTPERLARIDAAERLLRSLGLDAVRVRCHQDDLARIEAPLDRLAALCQEPARSKIVASLREIGFRYVTLDVEG